MSSQQFPRAPLAPAGVGQGPAPTAGNSSLIPGGQPGTYSSLVHFRYRFRRFDLLQMNIYLHVIYTMNLLSCTLTSILHLHLHVSIPLVY